ncbi:hypothetical protein HDU96_001991 [Phlyctochytrium bullatum]|nr:hypothetical protein HDU96_001991 [Phlyctochytrium bullatum]
MRADRVNNVEPLDIVLFNGNDAVGNFISKVQAKHVVPGLKSPFGALWTHAGIIVDYSVLPLPCLSDGRLYIFESVFSGQVLGYVYSRVLPVDHEVKEGGFRLGPQLRDFVKVVEEHPVDIAVCKMEAGQRKRLMDNLPDTQRKLLDFYSYYKNWGYPLNPLPQFAAASPALFNTLVQMRNAVDKLLFQANRQPGDPAADQKVFCSELVAMTLKEVGVDDFVASGITPPEFTPVELNAMPSFRTWFYVRIKETSFIASPDGRAVYPVSVGLANFGPGYDENMQPLFISRARLCDRIVIGMTDGTGVGKFPFHGNKVKVEYEHEMLADLTGMVWVKAKHGRTPEGAIQGGCDEKGMPVYVARAHIVDNAKLKVGARKPPRVLIGGASIEWGGMKVAAHGGEHIVKEDYEVLIDEYYLPKKKKCTII